MGDQAGSTLISILRLFTMTVTVAGFLWGLAVFFAGSWVLFSFQAFESEFCITVMVIGVIYICWTSLAIMFIYRGPPISMYIYGCFMACLFLITSTGFIYINNHRHSLVNEVQHGMNMSLNTSNPPNINMEFTQKMLKCCGVSNYTDWVRLSPQHVIPMSCCIDQDRCVTANYNDIYQQGCFELINTLIKVNIIWLGALLWVVIFLLILGSILACLLAHELEKERGRDRILEPELLPTDMEQNYIMHNNVNNLCAYEEID